MNPPNTLATAADQTFAGLLGPQKRCPACGMHNDESAERCFACGCNFTGSVPPTPGPKAAAAPETPAGTVTTVLQESLWDRLTAGKKKMVRAAAAAAGALLTLVLAAVLVLYILTSPVRSMVNALAQEDLGTARTVYAEQIMDHPLREFAMGYAMEAHLARVERDYLCGDLNRIQMMRQYDWTVRFCQHHPERIRQIESQYMAVLQEQYDSYVNVLDTSTSPTLLNPYFTGIDTFMVNRLPEAEQMWADILQVETDRNFYNQAQQYAKNGRVAAAVWRYQQISGPGAVHAAAQEAIETIVTSFHNQDVRPLVAQDAPKLSALWNALALCESLQNYLPEHAMLQQCAQQLNDALHGQLRRTALEAVAAYYAGTMDCHAALNVIYHSLSYFPDDREVAAAAKPILMAHRRELMVECTLPSRTEMLAAALPEDPELQALATDCQRYAIWGIVHQWPAPQWVGVTELYLDPATNQQAQLYITEPYTDAHGAKWEPFNLLGLTAKVGTPGSLTLEHRSSHAADVRYNRLTADVVPGEPCGNGTATLDVYADGVKIHTVSGITRRTPVFQLELELPDAAALELRLTTKGGPVMLYIDGYTFGETL